MGECQCPVCGHATTGFEEQDYQAHRNAIIEECAELAEGMNSHGVFIAEKIRSLKRGI